MSIYHPFVYPIVFAPRPPGPSFVPGSRLLFLQQPVWQNCPPAHWPRCRHGPESSIMLCQYPCSLELWCIWTVTVTGHNMVISFWSLVNLPELLMMASIAALQSVWMRTTLNWRWGLSWTNLRARFTASTSPCRES